METLDSLREAGYTVYIKHVRRYRPPLLPVMDSTVGGWKEMIVLHGSESAGWGIEVQKDEYVLDPFGGETIAVILRDSKVLASGTARCSPKDGYCRKTGRDKALGRAVSALWVAKQELRDQRAIRNAVH